MNIRIVLADDHHLIRQGLCKILNDHPDFHVLAEAANGRECLQLVRKHQPDIVLMDISMPGLNGIEATRIITKELPQVKVLALSMHMDEFFIDAMLQAGASGYLLKDASYAELSQALCQVAAGQTYLSPAITNVVVQKYRDQMIDAKLILTNREREILQLIAEGKSVHAIASLLNISINTVATHRGHILEKLNLKSTAELVKYAIREGITSL